MNIELKKSFIRLLLAALFLQGAVSLAMEKPDTPSSVECLVCYEPVSKPETASVFLSCCITKTSSNAVCNTCFPRLKECPICRATLRARCNRANFGVEIANAEALRKKEEMQKKWSKRVLFYKQIGICVVSGIGASFIGHAFFGYLCDFLRKNKDILRLKNSAYIAKNKLLSLDFDVFNRPSDLQTITAQYTEEGIDHILQSIPDQEARVRLKAAIAVFDSELEGLYATIIASDYYALPADYFVQQEQERINRLELAYAELERALTGFKKSETSYHISTLFIGLALGLGGSWYLNSSR